jgi:transcriptional regulator with XRE-family HTH domain
VKQQREAASFSLRTLAARSGISPSMISDIERGAADKRCSRAKALPLPFRRQDKFRAESTAAVAAP